MIKLANAPALRAALREYQKVTKKTEAEIVNKTLKDVAFRASSFTPKTSAVKIRKDLAKPGLLPALAARWLRKKKGKFTKAELEEAMKRIANARQRHKGAIRVGWFPAIIKLGGRIRGSRDSAFSHLGSAAQGGAQKASISRMTGTIWNAIFTRSGVTGTKKWGGEIALAVRALDKAIAFVARDRLRYAERKLAEKLRKYS